MSAEIKLTITCNGCGATRGFSSNHGIEKARKDLREQGWHTTNNSYGIKFDYCCEQCQIEHMERIRYNNTKTKQDYE